MTVTQEQDVDYLDPLFWHKLVGPTTSKTTEEIEQWVADSIAKMRRSQEREAKIEGLGLKVSYRRHILRITNTRWNGGRLIDGTMHRQYQVTISGNTWPHRDTLRHHLGFRWDPGDRLWFRPMVTTGWSIHDNLEHTKNQLEEYADATQDN